MAYTVGNTDRFHRVLVVGAELRESHFVCACAASENLLCRIHSFNVQILSGFHQYQLALLFYSDEFVQEISLRSAELERWGIPTVPVIRSKSRLLITPQQCFAQLRDILYAVQSSSEQKSDLASLKAPLELKLDADAAMDEKTQVEQKQLHHAFPA